MIKLKTYQECIDEAKKYVVLLRLSNQHRMKVAEIACQACTIKHGGRTPITRFTLKDFGNKIGIDPKTLYEWTRQKRILYDKLNIKQKHTFDKLPHDAIRHTLKHIKKDSPMPEIRHTFEKVAVLSPVVTKLHRYVRNMDTIIYNLESYVRISQVPDEVLLQFIKKANTIIAFAEKALKERQKPIPKEIKKPQINWTRFWSDDIGIG